MVESRPALRGTAPALRWSLGLMALSGFAGLGYQIVWTSQSALWLGHEAAAVLAVVAAFFGGIATGALTMGPRIERSDRPVRWYAGCELVIAAWGMVLLFAVSPVSDGLLALTGAQPDPRWQWLVAFAGTFLLLLPATAAMGATLPALERVVARVDDRRPARSIAAHYASNTFGAVVGVIAAAFWLVPVLGLSRTACVCIALNIVCAIGALLLLPSATDTPSPSLAADASGRRRRTTLLFVTGLLGIGYEVVVVLVLGQVTEDTVYTFALLLAVYLLFSALGANAYRAALVRRRSFTTDHLLCGLALACLVGTATLWMAEVLKSAVLAILGASLGAALASETTLALASFALPTFVMGAVFSHLGDDAHAHGTSYGRSLGINVLGAAFAPVVFGVVLAPAIGLKATLLVLVVGYLALVTGRAWRRPLAWVTAAGVATVALGAPALAFVDVPRDGRVVSYRQGIMAAVSVVEDGHGIARLRINDRQQEGTSATALVDGRQALLPLLLQAAARRVLFLGLGTGVTAAAALTDPDVDIDAVELLPEVVEASAYFRRGTDPRLHLLTADARRYVRATDRSYDVIVADNYHPARSGSGALYTVEHFSAIRERLAPDGLFCQWLPLHQLDLDSLRSVVQSFLRVYPDAVALLANNSVRTPVVGLIGRRDGRRFDAADLEARFTQVPWTRRAAAFGLDDPLAVLGSLVAGPRALAAFVANAPANTDDRPIVAYRAPRITYAPDSRPADRLAALLAAWSIDPAEAIDDSDRSGVRLAAYWAARDRFIAVGRTVRPSEDGATMRAQVQAPLLDVLRISPDFRPAYDPLLRMAVATGPTDIDRSRRLLTELAHVQPARSEAVDALRALDSSAR